MPVYLSQDEVEVAVDRYRIQIAKFLNVEPDAVDDECIAAYRDGLIGRMHIPVGFELCHVSNISRVMHDVDDDTILDILCRTTGRVWALIGHDGRSVGVVAERPETVPANVEIVEEYSVSKSEGRLCWKKLNEYKVG